jgi:2'-5' RNA ligase
MRAFVAIELPATLRRDLRALQQRLAVALDAAGAAQVVRWTAVESIHLTLRFLGETDAALADVLARSLEQIAGAHAPFDLRLAGVGCFPNFRRPSVVWTGVGGEADRLLRLHAPIEELARRAGFAPETRPFSPHLTLGRFRREATAAQLGRAGATLEAAAATPAVRAWSAALPVHHVALMESDLRPGGAVYTARGVFPLSAA